MTTANGFSRHLFLINSQYMIDYSSGLGSLICSGRGDISTHIPQNSFDTPD